MKLFPETLRVRAFLLIAVLIVLSLATSTAIFQHVEQQPRTRQMAQLVVSVVNLTRAAVLSAAPEWRGPLLAELADAEGLQVQFSERDEVLEAMPVQNPEVRLMMEKVREQLGDETRFAMRRNGSEALWVSFFIGNDEFWVALPRERIEHPVSQVLLIGAGLVLLLSLTGGYLIARQVAHPLKKIAQAANQVGRGITPQYLPEQGAGEIVAMSRAFNQMSADLTANERERALVLAGISHDLRTPLTRIRLAAEMADDAVLRAGLSADVEQMDAVIRQFLDYARLDENEAAVPTDVAARVREVAQRFKGQAGVLELELQPLPPQNIRPLLLQRALSNLLDNAIKYGGGEITVRLFSDVDHIVLAVSDRGAGIPPAQQEAVKRPFVRLDVARGDAAGSGLGLAIVERAARLHGGKFLLETRDGGGLLAKLLLPITATHSSPR
ncbi:MAG: ATP-binding protein [Pseudomonadota bacterium]